ncbi:dynein regulatory complex protein 1, partial [Manacus vitellinus]|uniref:dynein regulatory complex protein 1 n=1 Tax=Manacus vitellinus TaxID=328815 RepID=UPI00115ED423
HFSVTGLAQFRRVWLVNEEEAKELIRKALEADRLIHVQQLGIPWEEPLHWFLENVGPLGEKPEKRTALRAAREALEEENSGKPPEDGKAKKKKGFFPPPNPSVSPPRRDAAAAAAREALDIRDSSGDAEYWEALAHVIPEPKLKLWDALDAALLEYHRVLSRRAELLSQATLLQQQNSELGMLLEEYLRSKASG